MSDVMFREATAARVAPRVCAGIVRLLADDPLGAEREDLTDLSPYLAAFDRAVSARIGTDPMQHFFVAERAGQLLGTMQLSLIPGLSRRGALCCPGGTIPPGSPLIGSGAWGAPDAAPSPPRAPRAPRAPMVQLTSDMSREDAHRFYERLGFERSHYGFKLMLR
jgi:hypothetical protein